MTIEMVESPIASVVSRFFDAFQRHDVDEMVELCDWNADFNYPPLEFIGVQRQLKAIGKVRGVGKIVWSGMFHSFPNLSVTIEQISTNPEGFAAVEATLSGTQNAPWGMCDALGRSFSEDHLFLMQVGPDNRLTSLSAYWNDGSVCRQLGHYEVD